MRGSRLRWIGLVLLLARASVPGVARADDGAAEQFEKAVRPVLIERCVTCHGPKKQGSGLRLDSRQAALEGGEAGPAIVPGEPDKSPLIRAIRHEGDVHMPPKGKLPEPAVRAMADWVKAGAPWPEAPISAADARADASKSHWAFQPVRKVDPPPIPSVNGPVSPVDAFVLEKLAAKTLAPSAPADRRTLLRRASNDLTGLPPTAAEFLAFEADRSPDAFAKAIDRLLASPRYGERWGRHWLDVARYADTKGYVFQQERRFPYAYTYRDYVVRAFNEDLPFDQFILQQLAADRLPPGQDTRPLAALGFLTVGRRFLNDENDIIDDRIDTVTRGLMGLTVACARCHDHKFDPIPTEDYYSLYGIFNSSEEPGTLPEIPESAPNPQREDFLKQLESRKAVVAAFHTAKHAEIQDELRKNVGAYLLAASDMGFPPRPETLDNAARARKVQPGRLRWLANRWSQHLDATRAADDPIMRPWHALAALPVADLSRTAAEVARAKGGNWSVIDGLNLDAAPPGSMVDVAARYAGVFARAEAARRDPPIDGPVGPDLTAIGAWIASDAGPFALPASEAAKLYNREEKDQLTALQRSVDELTATHPGAPPRAMVMVDRAAPREPFVFVRGNPGRPGKPVPRRSLKLLDGPDRATFKDGSGRLELARAIARKDNPLTARVMVNRIWMHHFGAPLVSTPGDFGVRSDPPSHPELLDYLAARFVEGGWSVKAMHRLIMLSATYQQRSDDRPEGRAVDPANRLLWRQNRRRLDFESMRDSLLVASGKLDGTLGGRPFPLDEQPFTARRTLYGFIDRQNLDGVYRTFDFASPDATNSRRFSTIVPQQALFLMNGPFVIEQARALAEQAQAASSAPTDVPARIKFLHERAFGRAPSPREVALGLRFLEAMAQAPPPTPDWTQGFGGFDELTGHVEEFTPFAHFKAGVWQFGPELPSPEGAHLSLRPDGGHVGSDQSHAAIRRWVAPKDAVVAIEGTLVHKAEQGDGVRARAVSGAAGLLGTWKAHHGAAETTVASVEVKQGQTIDFVVDCLADDNHDGFLWAPVVRMVGGGLSWDAKTGFQGPPPAPLTPLEAYAQVLLLTNEFLYVD